MTFDPEYFLSLAKDMVGDLDYDEDARYRTAVSRAYYAAHLISRKIFEEMGVKFPIDPENEGKIHTMVIDALIKVNEPTSVVLKKLRKIRNKADYDLDYNFKKYGVETLIGQAKDVINVMTIYKTERIEKGLGRKLSDSEYKNLVKKSYNDALQWAKEQSIKEGRKMR